MALLIWGLLVVSHLYACTSQLLRYNQEELGTTDRLRFTSGQYKYYNCTLFGSQKELLSDFKIGMYVHDHRTIVEYEVNDTQTYRVKTSKVEDFYFAVVEVQPNREVTDLTRFVKLTARHAKSQKFIDDTVLVLNYEPSRKPLLANTSSEIRIPNITPIGTLVGAMQVDGESSHVVFYIDESSLSSVKVFGVTSDGKIILIKSILKQIHRYSFQVNARYVGEHAYSSAVVIIDVFQPPKNGFLESRVTSSLQDLLYRKPVAPPEFVRAYKAEVNELLPSSVVFANIRSDADAGYVYRIVQGNAKGLFVLNSDGSVMISPGMGLDYEKETSYNLYFSGSAPGAKVRQKHLQITVEDANDNAPVFSSQGYNVSITEDTSIGEEILTLQATDADSGANGMVSFMILNEYQKCFKVSLSGSVHVSAQLYSGSRTPVKTFLNVCAFDWGHPRRQESCTIVQIIITPSKLPYHTNTSSACFLDLLMEEKVIHRKVTASPMLEVVESLGPSIRVLESLEPGTILGRFRVSDRSSGCDDDVLYAIISGNEDFNFNIDLFNGTLYMHGSLDREERSQYPLQIKAQSRSGQFISMVVNIEVEDVNDNPPLFSKSSYRLTIIDSSSVGQSVFVMSASDIDEGSNGEVRYSIVNQNKVFMIDAVTGVITLSAPLTKYPLVSSYYLEVKAADLGTYQRYSYASLVISVSHTPSSPLKCPSEVQHIRLPLETPVGTVVGRVFNNVQSLDEVAAVHYSVENSTSALIFSSLFTIHQFSGIIQTKASFPYTFQNKYFNVTIWSRYRTKGTWDRRCNLTVSFIHIQNTRPVFADAGRLYILPVKNIAKGMSLRTFRVALNGQLTQNLLYQVVDGNGVGYFDITAGNGQLFVGSNLLTRSHYWLTIQACLASDMSVYGNLHVILQVTLPKEFAPYFSPSVYAASVSEDAPVGVSVSQLFARDPKRKFSIEHLQFGIHAGDQEKLFVVDKTGMIYTRLPLSNHVGRHFVLNITVRNKEEPDLVSHGILDIYVKPKQTSDVNFFQGGIIPVYETSSQQPPYLMQVLFSDLTSNMAGYLQYELMDTYNGLLQINPVTATVSATGQLFMNTHFTVRIRIVDKSTKQQKGSVTLYMKVVARPSAGPHLAFSQTRYSFEVVENMGRTMVADLSNLLVNKIVHPSVFFYIIYGNEDLMFTITPGSKTLTTVHRLDAEFRSSYTIGILAFDGLKFAKTEIVINVVNLDDNVLQASQLLYEVHIPEHTIHRELLLKVRVLDADENDQASFVYRNLGDPDNRGPFLMSLDGEVYVREKTTFDREIQEEYVFTGNGGSTTRNASFCVSVKITDLNDHRPAFTQDFYVFEVLDSAKIGTAVGKVFATDDDIGINAQVRYSFVKPDMQLPFSIEAATGIISVSGRLAEMVSYKFELLVTDGGNPPLSSVVPLTIHVVEDLSLPRFYQARYEGEVMENLPRGQFIDLRMKLNSVPAIYGTERKDSDCVDWFWVEPFTGALFTNEMVDAEKWRNCSFTMTSSAGAERVFRTEISVKILDVNDNSPKFVNDLYTGSVDESKASYSHITDDVTGQSMVLVATDPDLGINAKVRYSILEDNMARYFQVDAVTGLITTKMILDREKMSSSFHFHVLAIDGGDLAQVGYTLVHIRVKDISDQIPRFLSQSYEAELFLPVYEGAAVIMVQAVDDDENTALTFSLLDTSGRFVINQNSGLISVKDGSAFASSTTLTIYVLVSDGHLNATTAVKVSLTEIPNLRTRFLNASIIENDSRARNLLSLNPTNLSFGSCLAFKMLNPSPLFEVDEISGVLTHLADKPVDRELVSFLDVHVDVLQSNRPVERVVVTIVVDDVNDNPPVFLDSYYKAVDIDTEAGVQILTVRAVDADVGENGRLSYLITSEETYNFQMEEHSGVLSLKQKFLKSLAPPTVVLTVEAADHGSPAKRARTTINLPIINKDQPIFPQLYNLSVGEDVQIGTELAVLRAGSRYNREVYYTIVSGDDFEDFDIGFTTGKLSVNKRLNLLRQSFYYLTVKAVDSLTGSWTTTQCSLYLLDSNNNYPVFEQAFYRMSVREDAKKGLSIGKVGAYDKDLGSNADILYSLASDVAEPLFSINAKSGVISLVSELDAEKRAVHVLSVTAADQGIPQLSVTTVLVVKVEDVNDNAPVFLRPSYTFFSEHYRGGSQFIGKVHATDKDFIDKDKLQYSLARPSPCLSMNVTTGVVYLVQNCPDGSQASKVSVTDGTSFTTVDLFVKFVDSNEHWPVLPGNVTIRRRENWDNQYSLVSVLMAADADKGLFGNLTYQIDSDALREHLVLESSGKLFSRGTGKFDREDRAIVEVPVRVTDRGGLFALTNVAIELLDENDNVPIFEFPEYEGNIKTNMFSVSSLLQVQVVDYDHGSNAEILYTAAVLDDNVPVKIEESTGLISLSGAPKGAKYQFSVRASDNGYPVHSSVADVQIAVKMWNENVLSFNLTHNSVSIAEGRSMESALLRVVASMEGFSGTVKYSLRDGNLPSTVASTHFRMDEESGDLYLVGVLDYEEVKQHKLMVRAQADNGSSFASTFVFVNVTNENDNPPVFQSRLYKFEVAEGIPLGTRLVQVVALDADDPTGRDLTYSFENAGTWRVFRIDSKTGWVSLAAELDYEREREYKFVVRVDDSAVPAMNRVDRTTVHVLVVDVNDSPPTFTKDAFVVLVKEDALIGSEVAQVSATDPDLNSQTEYFMGDDPHGVFAVDQHSGVLSTLRELTHQTTYRSSVIAYDGVHLSVGRIEVLVEPVNNHAPECIPSFYNRTLPENSPAHLPLLQVQAADADADDDLMFTVQGDGVDTFQIDQRTGVLSSMAALDFEAQRKHVFKVLVSDRAGHTCTADIFIDVTDENDNPPKFMHASYQAMIRENVTKSVVVTQVRAKDLDEGKNGHIRYQLLDNADGLFEIASRGIVTVAQRLTEQARRNLSVSVLATDDGEPALSSSVTLDVYVLGKSDEPPEFKLSEYIFNVSENAPSGTRVGRVEATSKSDGGIVVYAIQDSANSIFSISQDGHVAITESCDYETKREYVLNVQAWLQHVPYMSARVPVYIRVIDVNDNQPVFVTTDFVRQIDENVRTGTFVLQALATDKDSSSNGRIAYTLESVGERLPFAIDVRTAVLTVNGSIDRETQANFSFKIKAADGGSPSLFSYSTVLVDITDLNDNAPLLNPANLSAILQEDKPPGSTIAKISISDADSFGNGAPFDCWLVSGDQDRFKAKMDSGDVCSVALKESVAGLAPYATVLVVRVLDSGSPRQYSEATVRIAVVYNSVHPPRIVGNKIFFVIVQRPYGMTRIGQVRVADEDLTDLHQFSIASEKYQGMFGVEPRSGVIDGRPRAGRYELPIVVTDGKFEESAVVTVIVNEIDKQVELSSVAVVVSGMSASLLFSEHLAKLAGVIAGLVGTDLDRVFIWSVMETVEGRGRRERRAVDMCTVALAVREKDERNGKKYVDREKVKQYLLKGAEEFKKLGVTVELTAELDCVSTPCPSGQKCVNTLTPRDRILSYAPDGYKSFSRGFKCLCWDDSEAPCRSPDPCAGSPCGSGEVCERSGVGAFSCTCGNKESCGTFGTSVTLNGTAYIKYTLRKSFDTLFQSASVKFRTEVDGIIFFTEGKDEFTLEIRDGYAQLIFDFGSGLSILRIGEVKVTDAKWHHVAITRFRGNYMRISLDRGKLQAEGRSQGLSTKFDNGAEIIVGAGLDVSGKVFSGFRGCLQDMTLNEVGLHWHGGNQLVLASEAHGLKSNCLDSGLCRPDTCPRFSECVNTLSSFKCNCLPGHKGPACSSSLTCRDNPCQNGVCTYEKMSDVVTYRCNCPAQYAGDQCHIDLGACAVRPCQNGGECTPDGSLYRCSCVPGFVGLKCEVSVDPCHSYPCLHGARCVNQANDFLCECPAGKLGKRCGYGDYCRFFHCANGGTCLEELDGAKCECRPGFMGDQCEIDINECLESSRCSPANPCVNTYGSYYCNCSNDGTSPICSVSSMKDAKNSSQMVIVAACVGGILFIILIVVISVCYRRKKRSRAASGDSDNIKYPLDCYQHPPYPPPRVTGAHAAPAYTPVYSDYPDDVDEASAAMYDPSIVTFSGASSPDDYVKKVQIPATPARSSLAYDSVDEETDSRSLPGYHWDYSEVTEDLMKRSRNNRVNSREGSRIGLTRSDEYYEDCEDRSSRPQIHSELRSGPNVPNRPHSHRSSLKDGLASEYDSEYNRPMLPILPHDIRVSRQSLSQSESFAAPSIKIPELTRDEFHHRYSLLSEENAESLYMQDLTGLNYLGARSEIDGPSDVESSFQGDDFHDADEYTATSMNSDDESAINGDPVDPENTRKLERDIAKLLKDLQKRTEDPAL